MTLASPCPCRMAAQTLVACVWSVDCSGTSNDKQCMLDTSIGFWLGISSNNDVVVWPRTPAILVKKADGWHAPMNRGVSTADAPPQIWSVRAMCGSSAANSRGGARARTCQQSFYTVSRLGTCDNNEPYGASQSLRPDHGMNRRRDPLPPIEQHNVCARCWY
jgi:hypothetical protein